MIFGTFDFFRLVEILKSVGIMCVVCILLCGNLGKRVELRHLSVKFMQPRTGRPGHASGLSLFMLLSRGHAAYFDHGDRYRTERNARMQ